MGNLGTSINAQGTTFANWIGAGTAFVVILYDQSGRGRNASQSIISLQPTYNSAGQYVDFTGSCYLAVQGQFLSPGNASYSYVIKHGSIANSNGGVFGMGSLTTGRFQSFRRDSNGYKDSWFNVDMVTFGKYVAGNIVSVTYDGNYRKGFVNNMLVGSTPSSGHRLVAGPAFLGQDGNSEYLNGQLFSLVIVNAALNTVDRSYLEGCAICSAGMYQLSGPGSSCMQCPSGRELQKF